MSTRVYILAAVDDSSGGMKLLLCHVLNSFADPGDCNSECCLLADL